MSRIIMGINLKERMSEAAKLQSILSDYGCSITTRLGLHQTSADSCSPSGLIILEFLEGAEAEAEKLENEVRALGEVDIQKMVF